MIDKDIIKDLTSKMKNVKAAELSRLLSETVKPTRDNIKTYSSRVGA